MFSYRPYHPDPQPRCILGPNLQVVLSSPHVRNPDLASEESQKLENKSFPADCLIRLQILVSHIYPDLFIDVHSLVNLRQARRPYPWSKLVNPCISIAVGPLDFFFFLHKNTSQKHLWGPNFPSGSGSLTWKHRRQEVPEATKLPPAFPLNITRPSTLSRRIQQSKAKQHPTVILSQERGWSERAGGMNCSAYTGKSFSFGQWPLVAVVSATCLCQDGTSLLK